MRPRHHVRELHPTFVRIGFTAKRSRRPEGELLRANRNLRRKPSWTHGRLLRQGSLRLLELKVASILEAQFVAEMRGSLPHPARQHRINPGVAAAQARNATIHYRSRPYASR